MGLLNNVLPFSLIFWGQTQIASGLASILNATTPLFTLLFAGVALLIGPELLVGGASVWGELACLGAAISYAFAHRLGSARRPGNAVDGPRLRALFPHSGRRRRHQPAARYLPDTRHGHPAGRGWPGRTAGAAPLRRNGLIGLGLAAIDGRIARLLRPAK
jgi:hypothetical protein